MDVDVSIPRHYFFTSVLKGANQDAFEAFQRDALKVVYEGLRQLGLPEDQQNITHALSHFEDFADQVKATDCDDSLRSTVTRIASYDPAYHAKLSKTVKAIFSDLERSSPDIPYHPQFTPWREHDHESAFMALAAFAASQADHFEAWASKSGVAINKAFRDQVTEGDHLFQSTVLINATTTGTLQRLLIPTMKPADDDRMVVNDEATRTSAVYEHNEVIWRIARQIQRHLPEIMEQLELPDYVHDDPLFYLLDDSTMRTQCMCICLERLDIDHPDIPLLRHLMRMKSNEMFWIKNDIVARVTAELRISQAADPADKSRFYP
jgi:hypothetical protein